MIACRLDRGLAREVRLGFLKLIPSFVQGWAGRLALAAAGVDTLLIVVVLVILSGATFSTGLVVSAAPYPYIFATSYVVLFFVIWFILYIQTRSENENGYTIIRRKLVGTWIVDYSSPYGVDVKGPLARAALGCFIIINPDNRKLELKFIIKDNRVYEDDKQTITAVTIRREHDYQYNLFYYYTGLREIQKDMADALESDGGQRPLGQISFTRDVTEYSG
jgi:hypothetical protein